MNSSIVKILIIGLLYFNHHSSYGQVVTNKNIYDRSDGIVLGQITALESDTLGMLWFMGYKSTVLRHGFIKDKVIFQRFNGFTFTTVTLDTVLIPKENPGWIVTLENGNFLTKGVSQKSEQTVLVEFNPYDQSHRIFSAQMGMGKCEIINMPVRTREGWAWIITDNRLNTFLIRADSNLTITDQSIVNHELNINHENPSFTRILYDRDDLIISMPKGSILLDKSLTNKRIQIFDSDLKKKENLSSYFCGSIHYLNKKIFLLCDSLNRITTYTKHQEKFYKFTPDSVLAEFLDTELDSLQKTAVVNCWKLGEGLVLMRNFGSRSEIRILDRTHKVKSVITTRYPHPKAFFTEDIEEGFYYADKDNLIYVPLKQKITPLQTAGRSIRNIEKYRDKMLITTETKGWYLLDLHQLTTRPFPFGDEVLENHPAYNRFLSIEELSIWSNELKQFFKFDFESEVVKYYDASYEIQCALVDQHHIYYGTNGYGLQIFNKESHENSPLSPPDQCWQLDLLFSKDSTQIYIATNKGLQRYSISERKLYSLGLRDVDRNAYIMCLARYSSDEILVGTFNGEIYLYQEDSENFVPFYLDSLRSPIADLIVSPERKTLWISTFNGLVRYNMAEETIRRFGTVDGLSNNECNRYSQYIDSSGRFFVGTIDGFNLIQIDDTYTDRGISIPILRSARFYSDETGTLDLHDSPDEIDLLSERGISLPPTDRFIEFEFGLSKITNVEKYNFQYQLNNLQWQPFIHKNKLQFLELSPGKYELKVRVVGDLGNPVSDQVLKSSFTIRNIFYRTPLFQVLASLVLLFIVYLSIRRVKEKHLKQKQFTNELLKVREEELSRIAREIHDGAGQSLILLKQRANKLKDSEFSTLTQNALDELRSISHNIHPSILDRLGLEAALENLTQSYHSKLFLTLDIQSIDDCINIENQLHIYRIIQESISNVVKHSGANALEIYLEKKSNEVVITISDNGKGLEETNTAKKKGFGLRSIEERAEMLGGIMKIESKTNKGTTLIIKIPILNPT